MIQITLQTRAVNGGIMGVDDVVKAIQNSKYNGKKGVSQEDVIRAVDKLAILGINLYSHSLNLPTHSFIHSLTLSLIHTTQLDFSQSRLIGSGFRIIQLTTSSKPRLMLLSVPMELNLDHEVLMKYAHDNGYISPQMLLDAKGWSFERFNIALHPLLYEGMLWVDLFRNEKSYYFYSI